MCDDFVFLSLFNELFVSFYLCNHLSEEERVDCFTFIVFFVVYLTLISLASFLDDLDKQCRPSSDATERGVCSGSPLFAYGMFY